jgi:hypothetical protein
MVAPLLTESNGPTFLSSWSLLIICKGLRLPARSRSRVPRPSGVPPHNALGVPDAEFAGDELGQ